jgi:hypothetical protein
MNARGFRLFLGASTLLLAFTAAAQAEAVRLAVRDGQCEWVQPARTTPCILILGSPTPTPRPIRISVQAEFTTASPLLPRDTTADAPLDSPQMQQQLERLRRCRQPGETYPPLRDPPRQKTFSLFVAERDLENAAGYVEIRGELRAVGKHVQIYLDAQDAANGDVDHTITEVVRGFDQEVYPWSALKLGQVADVDRDGRFTILLSSRLQRLQGGKVALDGFVRGSDFLRDVGAPFGNRCDMMYLNANLRPGPHLRTVLAHEFTHAVTFSEHVLNNPPGHRHDEESWLGEGLAHLVEDLHQHGRSNLDYRVSAYLSQPERYPLVVADYYGSGLWRTPETRGSVYLFLRWCHVRTGPELPRRLIQSAAIGVRNLEDATRRPFAETFRDWGVSLVQEDFRPLPDRMSRSQESAGRPLCAPHFSTLKPGKEDFVVAGTALKFVLVPSADRNRRVHIQTDKDVHLQATLVPIAPERGLLSVGCRRYPPGSTSVVLDVTAHGSPVRLETALWERLTAVAEGQEDVGGRDLSGRPQNVLAPGETRSFTLVDFLPLAVQELAIKVRGTDAAGRSVVGIYRLP